MGTRIFDISTTQSDGGGKPTVDTADYFGETITKGEFAFFLTNKGAILRKEKERRIRDWILDLDPGFMIPWERGTPFLLFWREESSELNESPFSSAVRIFSIGVIGCVERTAHSGESGDVNSEWSSQGETDALW